MTGSKQAEGAPPEASAVLDAQGNAARAIAAATAQIDLALREAHGPVEALGHTLASIAEHLQQLRGQLRAHTRHCGNAEGLLAMDLAVEALSGEMAKAIQSMQFYDRLFQHLSHVHDYLNGGAETLASTTLGEAGPAAAQRWEVLRERLFARLLSESQRQVLDIVLPPSYWNQPRRGAARGSHAGPGDIELF